MMPCITRDWPLPSWGNLMRRLKPSRGLLKQTRKLPMPGLSGGSVCLQLSGSRTRFFHTTLPSSLTGPMLIPGSIKEGLTSALERMRMQYRRLTMPLPLNLNSVKPTITKASRSSVLSGSPTQRKHSVKQPVSCPTSLTRSGNMAGASEG
jgi:hypothetical protein